MVKKAAPAPSPSTIGEPDPVIPDDRSSAIGIRVALHVAVQAAGKVPGENVPLEGQFQLLPTQEVLRLFSLEIQNEELRVELAALRAHRRRGRRRR